MQSCRSRPGIFVLIRLSLWDHSATALWIKLTSFATFAALLMLLTVLFVLYAALWLSPRAIFMFCPVCCRFVILYILSSNVLELMSKRDVALLCFVICVPSVRVCFSFCVIGRLYYMTISGYQLI